MDYDIEVFRRRRGLGRGGRKQKGERGRRKPRREEGKRALGKGSKRKGRRADRDAESFDLLLYLILFFILSFVNNAYYTLLHYESFTLV